MAPNLTKLLLSLVLTVAYFICNAEGVCSTHRYSSDDCGVTDEIPGETRTQMPWTAAVFQKQDPDSNYTFHATGTVIGPTTILTLFSGVPGKLARKIRGKHSSYYQDKEAGIVIAGIKSGDIADADKYTQISEISFIEPYLGSEEVNRDYHFVLVHLKTPLDLSTPYVRPACLSHFKLGRKANDASSSTFLHGGFAKKKVKGQNGHQGVQIQNSEVDWEVELKLQVVITGTGYECVKTYEKYYEKSFPAGMFCSKIPYSTESLDASFFPCLLQGSSIIQKIGHQWYLAGVTSMIRGRKAGICKGDAIYFNTRLSTSIEWIERSLRCSPLSFSCSDGTCIPLESVCNSVRNCLDNGLDENEILCETNRKCYEQDLSSRHSQDHSHNGINGKYSQHQCNLVGGCISKEQVCDGIRDCDEGSDESPTLCNKDAGSRSSRDLSPNVIQYCLPLAESEGVQIEYISMNHNALANCTFIPINTFALSKCKPYYKSKNLYSHLEQQCNDNGKWSSHLHMKFECEPDCGLMNQKPSLQETPSKDKSLPWHALIFTLHQPSQQLRFVCGATLIHKNYLVTAGHCFAPSSSLKSYKVILSPMSKNFSKNLNQDTPELFEIDRIWRPDDFDMVQRISDIALIKLKRHASFGAYIRPVCLNRDDDGISEAREDQNNVVGIMALSSGIGGSVAISGLHVSSFPQIVDMACIPKDFFQLVNSGYKCVGHKDGFPVRQQDTGGGLISLVRTNFGTRHVLRGIMNFEEDVNAEQISHFTSFDRYRKWILGILGR